MMRYERLDAEMF